MAGSGFPAVACCLTHSTALSKADDIRIHASSAKI
jgi:hypothetical protein